MKNTCIFLFLLTLFNIDVNSQNDNNVITTIKGSDEYLSCKCNDSCKIIYKNYIINTIPNSDGMGDNIIVKNRSTKTRIIIDVDNPQYFLGLLNDQLFIDAGTYIVRQLYIYDLKTRKILFSTSYCKDPEIKDNKIYYTYVYGDDKPKQLPDINQKKQLEKMDVDFGIVEDRVFDLNINKIIKSENTRYSTY